MANQNAVLDLKGGRTGPRSVRMVLVDSDGGAVTFTDLGGATTFVCDDEYTIMGVRGQGTTAPATATAFQFNINGNDRQAFIIGAAAFDPNSTQQDRLGPALGTKLAMSTSLAITGRA